MVVGKMRGRQGIAGMTRVITNHTDAIGRGQGIILHAGDHVPQVMRGGEIL